MTTFEIIKTGWYRTEVSDDLEWSLRFASVVSLVGIKWDCVATTQRADNVHVRIKEAE